MPCKNQKSYYFKKKPKMKISRRNFLAVAGTAAVAAAAELGQNIEINYFYAGQFYGDANITSRMEGWYSNGTQAVFACGGGIYTSAVEAALKNDGYVVGVDVDQNYVGEKGAADGTYAYNPFLTSAMKGLSESVNTALSDIEAGSWGEIAGTNGNFGLEDGDCIGLPTAEASWHFQNFTVEDYEALKAALLPARSPLTTARTTA